MKSELRKREEGEGKRGRTRGGVSEGDLILRYRPYCSAWRGEGGQTNPPYHQLRGRRSFGSNLFACVCAKDQPPVRPLNLPPTSSSFSRWPFALRTALGPELFPPRQHAASNQRPPPTHSLTKDQSPLLAPYRALCPEMPFEEMADVPSRLYVWVHGSGL